MSPGSIEMARNGRIYQLIDDLDNARNVAELVAKLKPILNTLAYYVVTGEGVVQETHEEWHTDFTDRLYDAVSEERSAPAPATAPRPAPRPAERPPPGYQPGGPPYPLPPQPAGVGPRGGGGQRPQKSAGRRATEGGFADSSERGAPGGGRPRPSDLPPSLRSIMDGTHPSFTEGDYGH